MEFELKRCSSTLFRLFWIYSGSHTKAQTSNSLYCPPHGCLLPDSPWLSLTCTRLLSHLTFSPEKWSLTQAVLALNPPGAVLKRHCSNVDRNTFIGIVSPFKKWLGVALAATGRLGWFAGHLISISPALDSHQAGASDRASHHGGDGDRMGAAFYYFKPLSTKLIFLANISVSSS